jgi:hypothetical protein
MSGAWPIVLLAGCWATVFGVTYLFGVRGKVYEKRCVPNPVKRNRT